MRKYVKGQVYPFDVIEIREVNERKFIYLSDGYKDTFRVIPFDFQLEWEPYNLPKVLNCYVVRVNQEGLPLLSQVRKEVLAHNYTEEGTEYPFKIVAKRKDVKSSSEYYELHDPFGLSHRYYPRQGEPEREVADIFSLIFQGIEEKEGNNAFLKLAPIQSTLTKSHSINEEINEGLAIGSEGESMEFKSTIIFPAGSIEPDVDRQMVIICKTIAGFMNKDGGELLIGVNDSGMVVGIDQDFKYLNSSKIDTFSYQTNIDGYENKIRTTVKNQLGNAANANIQISFPIHEGVTYCKIKINEVLKPIFLNHSKLYQRAGNMTQLLKGDEIAWFVEERYRKRIVKEGGALTGSRPENMEEVEEVEIVSLPETNPVLPPINYKPEGEKLWYWMTFYENGDWSFDTKQVEDETKVFEVSIPFSLKNERLIMAYRNGCVNVVVPYDQIKPKGKSGRKLRKKGHRYSNGWNTDSEILNIFCVDKKDLLVFKSKDSNDIDWVKIHNVSAISVHGTLNLAGNVLINPKFDASIVSISPLPIHYFHLVSALVLKDHQTSGYLGYRRKDKTLDKVFRVLDQILEKEK
ncbi:ATP-binding protein [Algoriphagus kandeliae]|uniref:ATP-binding protein n=1 Tax=Algoriphagus kandeliae TaxID=2562278 RepID=A0A4Y9QPE0_9BACT|nr:ATP-binding protein [Algoriphagus kandeliae]TFV94494.1 ATP-binding protein [Algoriphagus kandeliae]